MSEISKMASAASQIFWAIVIALRALATGHRATHAPFFNTRVKGCDSLRAHQSLNEFLMNAANSAAMQVVSATRAMPIYLTWSDGYS